MFGTPEFSVKVVGGHITSVRVLRGAPCGATWDAALRVKGLPAQEAIVRIGLEVQYFCIADPSDWDPISVKSSVHLAGEFHKAALNRDLKHM